MRHGPPLPPGTVVADRYQIDSVLGEGGMARVYRARHRELGRDVALKLLPPSAMSDDLWQRFEREARNGARLDHRGCARVMDFGTDERRARFLVMELLSGPTLRAELRRRGRLPVAEAERVGSSLLAALEHAHRAGILHRDLKPENIMYRQPAGDLVLIDFGLSLLRDDAPLTATGSCVGSPTYLAPERLLERPYDGRADLYAVGVILYELLAGVPPFVGASPTDVGERHLSERPVPLFRRRHDVPASLAALIQRALEKDPERRFPDAATMRRALIRPDAATALGSSHPGGDVEAEPLDPDRRLRPSGPLRRALSWLRRGRKAEGWSPRPLVWADSDV